jgi:transposase-like protein
MSKRKFDEEFKENAVKYRLKNQHKSLEEIAEDLGIGTSTISKWINFYDKTHDNTKSELTLEQKELKSLRLENKDLKEVNEILKKAHKYFVSQSL